MAVPLETRSPDLVSEHGNHRHLGLMDDAGQSIARVRLVNATGRVVEIAADRRTSSALLAYLYGKGRRSIWVDSGELRLHGRLSTEWKGHRRWFVQLG